MSHVCNKLQSNSPLETFIPNSFYSFFPFFFIHVLIMFSSSFFLFFFYPLSAPSANDRLGNISAAVEQSISVSFAHSHVLCYNLLWHYLELWLFFSLIFLFLPLHHPLLFKASFLSSWVINMDTALPLIGCVITFVHLVSVLYSAYSVVSSL